MSRVHSGTGVQLRSAACQTAENKRQLLFEGLESDVRRESRAEGRRCEPLRYREERRGRKVRVHSPIDLPWEAIASVERRRRSLPEAPTLSLTGSGDTTVLNHAVQDGTDVDIELEQPTVIDLPQGQVTVWAVRISVDDTDAFLDAVRTHIP